MQKFIHTLGLVGAFASLQACFTYVPIQTEAVVLPAGEHVAFQLTDRGRVGVSDRLGPGIVRIEGLYARSEGNDYVINVAKIAQISGGSSRWSGEAVRLNRDFVGRVELRQLSQSRTWITVGLVSAGLAAFVVSRGLIGSFNRDEDPPEVPPPNSSRAGWPR